MNINKENYEEYFLLFADDELSDLEKSMVEDFVKQHAELEEEFLNIKQSILKPDNNLKFDGKSSLHRNTNEIISFANYEEIFILYNDNELTSPQRKETENFLEENPSLQNEFELFQRTKLQPDKRIIFPNKSLLFKTEDSGKVVLFKWWKAVAAAVLLGGGIWAGINFERKSKNVAPVAVKDKVISKPDKIAPALINTIDTINSQKNKFISDNKPAKHSLKQKSFSRGNAYKMPEKAPYINAAVIRNKKQTNNLPQIYLTDKPKNEEADILTRNVRINTNDNMDKRNDIKISDEEKLGKDEVTNMSNKETPGALTTSYTGDESNSSNDYAFYNITEEKFNKSKVGGFLRKMKRIIERKISPLNNSRNQREMAVN